MDSVKVILKSTVSEMPYSAFWDASSSEYLVGHNLKGSPCSIL